MSFKSIYEKWADNYDLMYRQQDGGIGEFQRLYEKVLPPDLQNCNVLEVGCGTGQAAAALALAGHRVTAIDFSQKKLEVAHSRAERLGLDIEFRQIDFLESPTDEAYDIIFALSSFVTHFLDEEQQFNCIQRFHECLKADGIAVIGIYDYGVLMRDERDISISDITPISRQEGNILYFQRRTWNGTPRNPVHKCCYFMVPDTDGGTVQVTSMFRRAITPVQLSEALIKTGFASTLWYSPTEADHYQSICVSYRQENTNQATCKYSTLKNTAALRTYLVWDGNEQHKSTIEIELTGNSKNTFLHFIQILDSANDVNSVDEEMLKVSDWVEKLQSKIGPFEFSMSCVNRSEFSKRPDIALVQAYIAAQVMMSAELSTNDTIYFFSNSEGWVEEDYYTEMIRCIARTEEIPIIQTYTQPVSE